MLYSEHCCLSFCGTPSLSSSVPPPKPSPPWRPPVCSLHPWSRLQIGLFVSYLRFHVKTVLYAVFSFFWLSSLGMMIWLHPCHCTWQYVASFMAEWHSIVYMCASYPFHLLMGVKCWFHFLAIVTSAALNIGLHVSWGLEFYLDIRPRMGLLDRSGTSSRFWGSSIMFSIMAVLTDVPPVMSEVPFNPHLFQHLLFVDFLMTCYLTVVIISFS